MDISELQRLPVDQKIELIGQLWDEIDDSNSPIVLSPEVIAEVDRRCAELAANPDIAIDRDDMWRRANELRRRNG